MLLRRSRDLRGSRRPTGGRGEQASNMFIKANMARAWSIRVHKASGNVSRKRRSGVRFRDPFDQCFQPDFLDEGLREDV